MTPAQELSALSLDERFLRELPGDPIEDDRPRQVMGACWSPVRPATMPAPRTLAWSAEVAELLGFSPAFCRSEEFARVFAGQLALPAARPWAQCYGGQQFGNWAGQLGDGRAMTIGTLVTPQQARMELQLKGAGRTPYSRGADGRAVLRSSVREFLCSEAMHHLGVPTTRALSLVATGEDVVRDMFYDGNPRPEPGAIVCRVAPTFLRFGSYQIHAARQQEAILRRLVAHTLRWHFPELLAEPLRPEHATVEETAAGLEGATVIRFFEEVCRRTAELVAHWMRVGFVHGVLNTDNMSITGLTIDYGPYGWLEGFDPMWTPNTTDAQGRRYAYGRQPEIGYWNCAQLGGALLPLVEDKEALNEALQTFPRVFEDTHRRMMQQKIGLREGRSEDDGLVESLMEVLQAVETDMTLFFRRLADVPVEGPSPASRSDDALVAPLLEAFYAEDAMDAALRAELPAWVRLWVTRLRREGETDATRRTRMNGVNPLYVLRNWLAQEAIDAAAEGDPGRIAEQLEVLRRPYEEQPGREHFAKRRPEWARHRAGCSMLSCSS